ncbi:phosphatidate cytidylyltransferase [Pacificoceanicola onchidii]|uniref:phosphatidate cytidylyltransferase n=1 Tax=Pacificoceanicola onchidii TaxID=2562685 RepID=UPI0010A6B3E1|nr:phosphatidate cytidylyltransferase [Pacificoceanicola onchidii]
MSAQWSDLRARVLSAIVMLGVAIGAFLSGPVLFVPLVACATGAMIWELSRMQGTRWPAAPLALAALVAVAVLVRGWQQMMPVLGLDLLLALVLGGVAGFASGKDRGITGVYAAAVALTGILIVTLLGWRIGELLLVTVLGVVILTDVAGYFAGRILGGPKFWPKVSPKKTWSGVIAGWLAAGVFGLWAGLAWFDGALMGLAAMVMSFASQLGDIAESALKRRAGIKDSSNLIPGHGGFLDRFDGVVGAMLVLALVTALL